MNSRKSLAVGTVAAIGASVCCAGPLLLVMAGISGTWISKLTAFEPYRPIFLLLTLACLGFAFHRLYFDQQNCDSESGCDPKRARRSRILFWVVAIPLLMLLAFPWYAPYLF